MLTTSFSCFQKKKRERKRNRERERESKWVNEYKRGKENLRTKKVIWWNKLEYNRYILGRLSIVNFDSRRWTKDVELNRIFCFHIRLQSKEIKHLLKCNLVLLFFVLFFSKFVITFPAAIWCGKQEAKQQH